MAFALYSDVREICDTEGTGAHVLDGAVDGFWPFSARYSNNDTMFVEVRAGDDRELFFGTYNSGANSVSRTQIYKSTNSNNAVDWGAGLKEIFVTNIGPSDLDSAGKALLLQAMGATTGGVGYSNLKIDVTSVTALTITARKLSVEDSSGNIRWLSSVSVSAAITTSGANGLDTGSEASNTFYFVYVIYNPTTGTAAALLSTSATSPTLPSGYTYSVRVGAVRNNASSNLITTIQRGNIAQYVGGGPDIPVALTVDDFSLSDYAPSTAVAVSVLAIWSSPDDQYGSVGPSAAFQFGADTLGKYVPATFLIETAATIWAARFGKFIGWVDGL